MRSFYHLSSPDLLLGMDADRWKRNVAACWKPIHTAGLRTAFSCAQNRAGNYRIVGRQNAFTQRGWILAVSANPLAEAHRDKILVMLRKRCALPQSMRWLFFQKSAIVHRRNQTFAIFLRCFGLVDPGKACRNFTTATSAWSRFRPEHHRRPDRCAGFNDPHRRAVEPYSYQIAALPRRFGYPEGIYRLGLAPLNIIDRCDAPLADEEWANSSRCNVGAILSLFIFITPG